MTMISPGGSTAGVGDSSDGRYCGGNRDQRAAVRDPPGLLAPGSGCDRSTWPRSSESHASRSETRSGVSRPRAWSYIDGRRGARVATLSADEVSEIYETRSFLEVHCIRLAVRNMTDAGVEHLIGMSNHMDAVAHHARGGPVGASGVLRRTLPMERATTNAPADPSAAGRRPSVPRPERPCVVRSWRVGHARPAPRCPSSARSRRGRASASPAPTDRQERPRGRAQARGAHAPGPRRRRRPRQSPTAAP